MEITEVALTEITPYEFNPRNNDGAVEAVMNSIREFGFKVPIVLDKDKTIVAGHTRYKAALRLGMETVPCILADDLTDEQVKAFRLADNKVAELAGWDDDLLSKELQKITDLDMTDFGFDEDELNALLNPDAEAVEDDFDIDSQLQKPAVAQRGDIFLLGRHRLMCGDSTDILDVEKLMGGEKADLYLTDPPYNVALGHEGDADAARKKHRRTDGLVIANDDMDGERFVQFLRSAFYVAQQNMKAGASFYIWHAHAKVYSFITACIGVGWNIRQFLIWNKNSITLTRQDYQWKHEPCLYGWNGGASHYFIKKRNLATVIGDGIDFDMMTTEEMRELLKGLAEQLTVLDCDRPTASKEHPTMKPVALFGRLITNSSKVGDIVLDSFGGSGTTMIACEQLGRSARLMELDEKYCDVIVNRYASQVGSSADVRIERDGKQYTFAELYERSVE